MSKNLTIAEANERIQRLQKFKHDVQGKTSLVKEANRRIEELQKWISNHSRG